ncbi:hypothetical protein QBC40DRAFT_343871 [Triangularia verruculosa]|uniref:Uncharacterized protein n=1 Tax=Triangularia verruculosa TaxID=2587418 RepID=A0AAN6X705_9PEZI|nr:hypothetical protein QBC40DRAFT_343871 [Triangularia verruculosa]
MFHKVFSAIAAFAVFFTHLTRGVPLASEAPFKGQKITNFEWRLPIDLKDPTSKTVTVTGTIQEAIDKMDAAYPGWNETFTGNLGHVTPGTSLSSSLDHEQYFCNPDDGYDVAHINGILTGIDYLRELTTAAPENQPLGCGRVSCTLNSGIYWCNNNNFAKQVTWTEIGDSAYFLAYQCDVWNDITWLTSGEEFFKDKWSVYVTAAAC